MAVSAAPKHTRSTALRLARKSASRVIALLDFKFREPLLWVTDRQETWYQCIIGFLRSCLELFASISYDHNSPSKRKASVQDRQFLQSGHDFPRSDSKILVGPLSSHYQSQTRQKFGSCIARCISPSQALITHTAVVVSLSQVSCLTQEKLRPAQCSQHREVECSLQPHDLKEWLGSRATRSLS